MTPALPIGRSRGGNHHPLATKQFILDYLGEHGEAAAGVVFNAYKDRLKELSKERQARFEAAQAAKVSRRGPGRPKAKLKDYQPCTYASFMVQFWTMVGRGQVEKTGRVELSDADQFVKSGREVNRMIFRLPS